MSPFRSKRQRRYMFARHPKLAEKWSKEYGTPRDLPERVGRIKRKSKASRATSYTMKKAKRNARYKLLGR